ncbi:hypothetical protein LINPERHAP2_LOCUS1718 [Linum perenne]
MESFVHYLLFLLHSLPLIPSFLLPQSLRFFTFFHLCRHRTLPSSRN